MKNSVLRLASAAALFAGGVAQAGTPATVHDRATGSVVHRQTAAPPPARLIVALRTQSPSPAARCPASVTLIASIELALPQNWTGPIPKIAYQFASSDGRMGRTQFKQPYASTSYFVVARVWPIGGRDAGRPRVDWAQLRVWWGGASAVSNKARYRAGACR